MTNKKNAVFLVFLILVGVLSGYYLKKFDVVKSVRSNLVSKKKKSEGAGDKELIQHFLPDVLSVKNYEIRSYARSFYEKDSKGKIIVDKDGNFSKKQGVYFFNREINSVDTALIVMDPWVGAEKKCSWIKKKPNFVLENRVIPVAKKAQELGLKIIVLTNSSEGMKVTAATDVHPYLRDLISKKQATEIYHGSMKPLDFYKLLNKNGIKNIIYVGFSADMCLLFRPFGFSHMRLFPLKIFYIPEASTASQHLTQPGEDKIDLLKAVTVIVSQVVGEIISYNDFMKINPKK